MSELSMYRGDTLKHSTTLRDSSGVAQNLTGWKVWWTVKQYVSDPDNQAVHFAASDDGSGDIAVSDAPNGKVAISMPPVKTVAFPDEAVTVVYDIQGKDAGGVVRTFEVGTIIVSPDVTRAT